MTNNKPEENSSDSIKTKDRHAIPDMTSKELIESIRGKIQRVLAEKAKESARQ